MRAKRPVHAILEIRAACPTVATWSCNSLAQHRCVASDQHLHHARGKSLSRCCCCVLLFDFEPPSRHSNERRTHQPMSMLIAQTPVMHSNDAYVVRPRTAMGFRCAKRILCSHA